MRLVLCDGCKRDLTTSRYDTVEVRGQRLDLCSECYPHYGEYEKHVEGLAHASEDQLNRSLHVLAEKFFKEVGHGGAPS